jgi:hypothetical protein
LALFEDVAQFGWVTENRYRPEGCAAGFYPVITIPQVRYKESMCGYATLMALSVKDARAMTDKGIQLHIKWWVQNPSSVKPQRRRGTWEQRMTQRTQPTSASCCTSGSDA